ncbi:MAG: methyl-coenzyme M reductase operon protein D [Methanosarcinales archaeon]|nr:methyl-coenzyme M reductase operon protein D [Methanosarcinales archaeon]
MVTTTDSDPVQYEIFPQRMLDPASAQELLNRLEQIGGVIRVLVQGPRLPLTVPYGPGKGAPVDHTDREIIRVGDQVMELQVKVGRIRLEAENDVMEEVRALCEELFPFPFELKEGLFLRRKATVTDYAKYGPDENVEDKRIYGMTDPSMTPTSKICESCTDTRE